MLRASFMRRAPLRLLLLAFGCSMPAAVDGFGRLRNTYERIEKVARGLGFGGDEASDAFAGCTDKHDRECRKWAQQGECDNNPNFMLHECRASCMVCQSQHCHDKQEACATWAEAGECLRNHDFMLTECPFSCGVCDVNFKAACRRDPQMQPAAVPGTIDATFRRALEVFQHLKPQVVHRNPWILYFDRFLEDWEADHLIKTAGHNFERSLAGDGVTPVRTSSTSWCNVEGCLRDGKFQEVRERIVNVTRVPWENAEHLQVLRYQPGQFYREHHDQNSPIYSAWAPRLYTFFMYLSNVDQGGETRFTHLNISVKPKKGSAILWPSVKSDDPYTIEEGTYHEAVTVDKGVKYAANFWIHMYEFQKALMHGCDNQDYFQDAMLNSSKFKQGRRARSSRR